MHRSRAASTAPAWCCWISLQSLLLFVAASHVAGRQNHFLYRIKSTANQFKNQHKDTSTSLSCPDKNKLHLHATFKLRTFCCPWAKQRKNSVTSHRNTHPIGSSRAPTSSDSREQNVRKWGLCADTSVRIWQWSSSDFQSANVHSAVTLCGPSFWWIMSNVIRISRVLPLSNTTTQLSTAVF